MQGDDRDKTRTHARRARATLALAAATLALTTTAAALAASPEPPASTTKDPAASARAGAGDTGAATRPSRKRPNVIVVMTDDQTASQLSPRWMPATLRKLKRNGNGTEFTESIVSTPLCCPSRAGYLTGQYPHNNGVYDNEPGYPALRDKRSTLYTWMQAAGYRTGHLGRFLLNYHLDEEPGDPDTDSGLANPPGVEHWLGVVGSRTLYYNALLSRNGTPIQYGSGPGSYTTRVLNREARDFVRAAKRDHRPFLLTVAHIAPHYTQDSLSGTCGGNSRTAYPLDGKLGPLRREPLPRLPSFGEPGMADKPTWIRNRAPIGPKRRQLITRAWRCSLAALKTVDSGIRALVNQLKRQGELDDTAIFFTADNGYLYGEHRAVLTKVYPYEESIRVPLLARVPERYLSRRVRRHGRPRNSHVLVNNLDLTATILDLANAKPCTAAGNCRTLDGRSLVPLLNGRRPRWTRDRSLLVQFGGNRECGVLPLERGLLDFYDAVRTKRHMYVELDHANPQTAECERPEFELYDLVRDPYQLRNRAVNPMHGAIPGATQTELATRLAKLRNCAGIKRRDPRTANRPFCG